MRHKRRFSKHSDTLVVDPAPDCPSGKRGYVTKAECIFRIKRHRVEHDREDLTLFAYKCKKCRCWHMTKSAPRD